MSKELETEDDVEIETDLPLPQIDDVLMDRYRVVAALGRGGSSKVFELEHVELGLRFAAKFLRTERAGADRTKQRFRQEARLLASLNHPGIARIVDIGYYRDVTPYMVLEHVAGETLRSRLRKQRPSLAQALEILLQVCTAIGAAHDKGIVHRDLKPENLMLTHGTDEELRVRVLDFGIARTLAEDEPRLTPTGAQLGTPHYMAPEQARGDKNVGPSADVFGLGVIFYELVSGERPHPGDSHYSVVFHLLTEDPVPLSVAAPDSPKDVRAVIERCLERKPEERYANARELGVAIAELCRVHGAPAAIVGRTRDKDRTRERAPRSSWLRNPWLAALGGVVGGYLAGLALPSRETTPLAPLPSATTPQISNEPAAEPSPLASPSSSSPTTNSDSLPASGERLPVTRVAPRPTPPSRSRPGVSSGSARDTATVPTASVPPPVVAPPAGSGTAPTPTWRGIRRNPYE
ncbi:MAG TPA: serine/threonine-protein kinase [Polyangiaceae bacterium]|nr:serine/threonine-protein kinase [Polyangiaceae bacterium]